MKIKTRLQLNTWIALGVITLIVISMAWVFGRIYVAEENLELASHMRAVAFERILLRDDYILHGDDKASIKWIAKSKSLRGMLQSASERFTSTEDRALIKDAQEHFETTFSLFSETLEIHKQLKRNVTKPFDDELSARVMHHVFLNAKDLNSSLGMLYESAEKAEIRSHYIGVILLIFYILSCITMIVANSSSLNRIITKRIGNLHNAVGIIGSGNLDCRIDEGGNDELSDMGLAINEMTGKLKESYTSLDNLKQEIFKRKTAEEAVRWQSTLVAAINRIFRETLTSENEGEITQTCLNVAQELTGSKFAFIGELTPEGTFSITALSNPAKEACRIPEKQAAQMLKDMKIRGIWEHVLLKEQSLIVNDLASSPFHIGTPEGHSPLVSFLGTPLKENNKVVGMIGLANRESGYTLTHQQDMEALAVAFLEAIRRKQVEEKIKNMNVELEARIVERTKALKESELALMNVVDDLNKHSKILEAVNMGMEAANKELEAFAYSVSHDLRAPLRAVDGYSRILMEDFGPRLGKEGNRICSTISESARHMGNLIDDLLAFSRIGRTAMNPSSVDMAGLARSIFLELTTSEDRERIDFYVGQLPKAQGDPTMIRQVWVNLISNAIKFSSKKERTVIKVYGEPCEEGIVYSICDNGAGFDMQYADKLFGVFQRLHKTKDFEGTGVGLAIVQRIVLRHGGRIWAKGENNQGATFYFTLEKGEQT